MSKMAWIHYLANEEKEHELDKHLRENCGFSDAAAKIGVKEFIKAANEIKESKNEMQSVRVQRYSKVQSKEKNSIPTFRKVGRNKKDS